MLIQIKSVSNKSILFMGAYDNNWDTDYILLLIRYNKFWRHNVLKRRKNLCQIM